GKAIFGGVVLGLLAGGVTMILGAKGAGKSTVVRLLGGEWRPDRGEVWWSDTPLRRMHRVALARQRAVVSQHVHGAFALRVLEVVMLGRLPHRERSEGENLGIAGAALEQVGLADLADRSIQTLSGGERQRAHLARALAQLHEARAEGRGLLLLDEPTAHLDLAQQHRFLHLVRALAREGMTVLVVLHDLHTTAAISDRVALLRRGRLLGLGSPGEVLVPALLEEAYGCAIERYQDSAGRFFFMPTLESTHDNERILE
ncbi:MAG TPA: ATP-binding cassette domain-containing protein, partial [Kiritimatiellia bacterium]|nr:ATP-binding cassette domain-containing protein [Kiritimatiellia bacterium]